ncbi:MAG: CBS domain-containing protein [Bryobacterales bacterium]|nr:CBS domain-containing protein [Bryobacterales bacterium]MBV9399082.1 CBS domain-containing protein [Bryobacterales bacterium]
MKVREVMTTNPVTLDATAPIMKAAEAMRDNNIGNIVVRKDGKLCGIVTDRDIVVRVLAAGKDPKDTKIESVCSHEILTISPDRDTSDAVKLMRQRAVRRLPVVDEGKVLGIVSLGDLAVSIDRTSALGDISAAPPNR